MKIIQDELAEKRLCAIKRIESLFPKHLELVEVFLSGIHIGKKAVETEQKGHRRLLLHKTYRG